MISKIDINNSSTFTDGTQFFDGLKKFNYIFGSNGSGKTTISRIIDNLENFSSCNITWVNGNALESKVYHTDFVQKNFVQQSGLKGVFTLGEESTEVLQKIEDAKICIEKIETDINKAKINLHGDDGNGGKKKELSNLEQEYLEMFWEPVKRFKKEKLKLCDGLSGVLNDRAKFKTALVQQYSTNQSALFSQEILEERAQKIFSKALSITQNIPVPSFETIIAYEKDPIFSKIVIGKENVDIATMINKLGNSDWVRQGISYYEGNENVCPFCQQKTEYHFEKSLAEYFDEAFENDMSTIDNLLNNYTKTSEDLNVNFDKIIESESVFLDIEKLKSKKQVVDSLLLLNIRKINQKKKESSQIIVLDSLSDVLNSIVAEIKDANKKIDEHNIMVKNISTEKSALTQCIWKFVIEELKDSIKNYNKSRAEIDAAIKGLTKVIEEKRLVKRQKAAELRELEKTITSIQPTCDEINTILSSFGFKSFKLTVADDNRSYKLLRNDGTEAQTTLSEGEKNFVAFLYFYHLIKGSHNEGGVLTNKIVVFDDPISSLDSDVLFIVSTLIRDIIAEVRDNGSTIKQVFILTHNIYFFKEVTFNRKRENNKLLPEESFWVVKKRDTVSYIEKQTHNPIKTSYELLWSEVSSASPNPSTIQNTIRRILENYFKILGGQEVNELYTQFYGSEKLICKALCSWINDGSHNVFGDVDYNSIDEENVEKYLDVFRKIFDKTHHISHYNMMMGISES